MLAARSLPSVWGTAGIVGTVYGNAYALAEQVRSGVRAALDVVEEALDAASRLDPVLHFLDRLDASAARETARRLEPTGPLAGVPFLVKARTPAHAPIITRLVAAGAIPIGTSTRARQGAVAQTFGWNGRDYTRNPWDLSRSPGGSSAGAAAAVAAGVVPLATGGDSGGSLRIPAAFCGVVGFKGTVGRIPRPGRALGGLTTSGVIGADLGDVIVATSIASGADGVDPWALPHWTVPAHDDGPWRVAYRSTLGGPPADPAVDAVVRSRLMAPGIDLVDARLDLLPPDEAWETLWALDNGRDVDAAAAARATAVKNHNNTALADLFSRVDVLVTPTTLTVAHGYDQHEGNIVVGDLCWGFNVTGNPAVSVPAGLVDGLPVGVQVIAAHGRDDIAVAVAERLRATLPIPPQHAG
jgi:amidase